ncbi:MAG: TrkA family potassium uptake protein [Candidatus Krumholzibacteriia bacterium]
MKVIIVGGGRPLYFLAQTFLAKGHSVTIINRDGAECERLASRLDAVIVHGDGSERRILEESGARSADLLLAATPSDPDNLITCQLGKSRFAVPRVVALVNDPDNQKVFQELGVEAISTALTVASLIEQRAALDQVTDLIPAGEGRVAISEVVLNDPRPLEGRTIADADFPRDALIAVVIRDAGTIIPKGDTILERGDRVVLVALAAARDQALKALTGRSP